MSKQRVVILGGFGFIGTHLANYLLKKGYEVTIFGHPNAESAKLLRHDLRCIHGDCANLRSVEEVVKGVDVVFHLIGGSTPIKSNMDPRQELVDSLLPSLSLFEICVQNDVRQLVFASSGGTVYGIPKYQPIDEHHVTEPICAYGISKLTTEHYMRLYSRLHGMSMTAIRLANPYGPHQNVKRGQGIIGTYCSQIVAGLPLQIWGDGEVVRDYVYIDDVVAALGCVIGAHQGFDVFNVGTGIGTSVRQLVEGLRAISEKEFTVNYLPASNADVPSNILDSSKFRAKFGWAPSYELAEGMRLTLEWYEHGARRPL